MQAQDQEELILIKGKRSKRPRPPSPLHLTMGPTSESTGGSGSASHDNLSVSSCHAPPSDSSHELMIEEDMANCLILLAKGRQVPQTTQPEVYQCKTCNKSFASFQALGGHRASHKRPVKPPPTLEEKKPSLKYRQEGSLPSNPNDGTILSLRIPGRISGGFQNKTRVHECSFCGAEFASGQALGGHMRRHRPIQTAASSASHGGESTTDQGKRQRNNNLLALDLNLPAPEDNHDRRLIPFATKEQVIVFSASPLVDCHIY